MNLETDTSTIEIVQPVLLLVDDEENILNSLRRLFRRDGYKILCASSGQEGLEVLKRERVDVIMSDQRMPNMTGTVFLSKARELSPHSVRLVLSGYTDLGSVTDAINEGAVYKFLTKPWEDEILRLSIKEALRHKWVEDENRMLRNMLLEVNEELAETNRKLAAQAAFAEQALRHQQHILHDLPIPIIGIDAEGKITLVNKAGRILLGAEVSGVAKAQAVEYPPELLELMQSPDATISAVSVAGQCFIAHKQAISDKVEGFVIVLIPT